MEQRQLDQHLREIRMMMAKVRWKLEVHRRQLRLQMGMGLR